MTSKYLPSGQRSINVPVTRAELTEAEQAVLRMATRAQEAREQLERCEREEQGARQRLSRLRSAIAKSGLTDH